MLEEFLTDFANDRIFYLKGSSFQLCLKDTPAVATAGHYSLSV
jgi:hypothetical protein